MHFGRHANGKGYSPPAPSPLATLLALLENIQELAKAKAHETRKLAAAKADEAEALAKELAKAKARKMQKLAEAKADETEA